MYTLDKDNLREIVEACAGGSEYELHITYALRFMVDNVHTPLEIGDTYTTDGKDGISSGLYQKLTGDKSYYLGFIDLHEGLTAIAKGFAGDEFENDTEFIRDATGEFINRINGEFVIASSKSDIMLEMEPQLFLEEDEAASVIKPVSIFHIPVTFGGSDAEMLFVKI
ncbi:MAG: hypothetical protein IJT96_11865 [Lachnospiraceae bacterium]|nr:hypothetical protein [Lachnospiraceae bacterium]